MLAVAMAAASRAGAPPSGVTTTAARTVAAIRLGVLTRSRPPEPPGLAGWSAFETGRIAQRLSVWEMISALTASWVSRVAMVVMLSPTARISASAAERADPRVLEDLEAPLPGRVGADRVGDVGQAVLVQRAGDDDRRGDGEQRGRERRERLVGERPGARRDRADERADQREEERGAVQVRLRVRADREAGEEGDGGQHRFKASIRRSVAASSRTAMRMCSSSRPRSVVGRTAMRCCLSFARRRSVPPGPARSSRRRGRCGCRGRAVCAGAARGAARSS